MGASPAKFLFGFLFFSVLLWIIFMFASRLLAWILSRVMGASVGFKIGGWKCLRDVVLKLNKGAVESISIGEIRLSLRQSLVKLGVGFMSRDPKLQVLICDLEVVLRPLQKGTQKSRSKKSRSSGRGKFMVLANMARFLSVSVTDLALKTPRATVDIKELRVDISKDRGSEAGLFVKLQLFPITVHLGESRLTSAESSMAYPLTDGVSPPFSCEEFSLLCEFGHNREAGVLVRNLDITSGEVRVNLNEDLLLKEKNSSDSSPEPSSESLQENKESRPAKKDQQGKQALAISKYTPLFPEKVAFTLPRVDVKIVHQGFGLVIENSIRGIQMKCMKSQSVEDMGESVKLDVQMEFSEIYRNWHLYCGSS